MKIAVILAATVMLTGCVGFIQGIHLVEEGVALVCAVERTHEAVERDPGE